MYFLNESLSANICRKMDWSTHELGPMENWPAALKYALSILFQNPTPMFLLWGKSSFCFYNDNCLPLFNPNKKPEPMGQRGELVWSDIWKKISPHLQRVVENKKSEICNDLRLKKSHRGKTKIGFWNYNISPVIDETGTSAGILTTCIETTYKVLGCRKLQKQAKLASQNLEEAQIASENAKAAKSVFLTNISHELRTPLGAIMGFSQLAREQDASIEDREKYLEVMFRNSHQVLRIVDDILDLAKAEAGNIVIEPMEIYLPDFLKDFISSMSFRAIENGIEFLASAETPLPEKIISDPIRLRQILTNAVGNAIKFTHNGFVRLQISFDDANKISFVITDTGQGISPEQVKHLFQPFTQADLSKTRKFGGTGLGLVLTRKLCQILDGNYSLEHSELGTGSTFKATVGIQLPRDVKILIPLIFFNQVPPSRSLPTARTQFRGTKTLIVEDCLDNQDLLKILLQQHGVEFDLAQNGQEGVELALKNRYDFLLMDIQMPVMDGHQAVHYLRSKNYSLPIIALTAHAMKEEANIAIKSGFTEYLSKPIRRETLVATLEKYSRTIKIKEKKLKPLYR